MGKSDPIIFNAYYNALKKELKDRHINNVAFMGFNEPNQLTIQIEKNLCSGIHGADFFDISRENWDINKEWKYTNNPKYDLIICTRCPFFAENPKKLINDFYSALLPGGVLLLDFGLGDHYRFNSGQYAVGFNKNGEQCYGHETKLNSVIWEDYFEESIGPKKFRELIKKFKEYDNDITLTEIVNKEMPIVVSLNELDIRPKCIDFVGLWPESPQLYIILTFKKE